MSDNKVVYVVISNAESIEAKAFVADNPDLVGCDVTIIDSNALANYGVGGTPNAIIVYGLANNRMDVVKEQCGDVPVTQVNDPNPPKKKASKKKAKSAVADGDNE